MPLEYMPGLGNGFESEVLPVARNSPQRLSQGSTRPMYRTAAQMLAHHASNGCALSPGDLLGSGTLSGPTREGVASIGFGECRGTVGAAGS